MQRFLIAMAMVVATAPAASAQGRMSEVAGIRIVPSILAHDVYLKPSGWMLRGGGTWANADARVFQNRDGAIIGLTLTAWGLPTRVAYGETPRPYVAWLVDSPGHRMLRLGTLDTNTGGRGMLGYSPEQPVIGFDRIVITQEPTPTAAWPAGWQQLEADLPRAAVLPPAIDAPTKDMTPPDQRVPGDERGGTTSSPL